MSAKHDAAKPRKVTQFIVPTELRPNTAGDFMDWLESVVRAGDLATAMLSNGVFAIDDPSILTSCIEAVATQEFDARRIETKRDRLERQLEDATLSDEQRKALIISLSDVVCDEIIAYSEAGYLLGLAVGQRVDLGKMGGAR